jgi:hypothetical protein
MQTTTRRTSATIGATLLLTVMAALAMLISPSPASAQGSTVSDGVIVIGPITVEQTDPCDMNGTNTHWYCENFIVSGGDPNVPNVTILAHVNLFQADNHFQILLVRVTLPSGCQINLHGIYLVNLVSGISYHSSQAAGAYLLTGCTVGETFLILAVLGGSPSTAVVLTAFDIS